MNGEEIVTKWRERGILFRIRDGRAEYFSGPRILEIEESRSAVSEALLVEALGHLSECDISIADAVTLVRDLAKQHGASFVRFWAGTVEEDTNCE